jgi:glycosyltransferase involved in cell wall biosynthesis
MRNYLSRKMNIKASDKIIINATNIGEKSSGIGIYSLSILKELAKTESDILFEIYVNKKSKQHIKKIYFPANFKIKWVTKLISPDYNFIGHLLRLVYSNFLSIFNRRNIFFNTSQLEVSFFSRNQVVTIHDVIPLLFPEYHKKLYLYFKILLKFALKKAIVIISPSAHTKKLLTKFYNIPPEKIEIIPNGVADYFLKQGEKKQVKEKYILYAGRISPMKNIKGIIEAYYLIKKKIPHTLIFIGCGEEEFKKEIKKGRLPEKILSDPSIIFKGYVDENEINNLMRGASLLIFPSLFEGFGLPPLEAMACNTPVVASSSASLPEVCGNAAHYVDPYNFKDIAEGILKVIKDKNYSQSLIRKGRERIKYFSWETSAKLVLNIIRSEMFPVRQKSSILKTGALINDTNAQKSLPPQIY